MTDSKQKQSRDWAFTLASSLERNRENMYGDGTGVPTIGVGYATIVKGRGDVWAVKDTLVRDMEAVGTPLTAQQRHTIKDIVMEKNESNPDENKIKELNRRLEKIGLEPEQRRDLYDLSYDRHWKELERAVGAKTLDKLPPEQQAALVLGTFLSPAAMWDERTAIAAGIDEDNLNKVVDALGRVGTKVKNPTRLGILAARYTNPEQTGKAPVEPGDYLGKIAQKYGTTVEALRMANPNINEQGTIFSGQALNLPEGAVTKESVYAAYAQQGIAQYEVEQHWADQVKNHKNGARLAALGLTVREARVMNDVAKGLDITGQGYSGPEMAAATRYSSTLERTNGDHDAAMRYAREGLAEARTYNGPSQEFSLGDHPFSAKDITAYLDTFRDSVTVPQKQNKQAAITRANLLAFGQGGAPFDSGSFQVASNTLTGLLGAAQPQAQPQAARPNSITVRPGETLSEIAFKNDTSVRDLMLDNPHIKDPDRIDPGDVIDVSSRANISPAPPQQADAADEGP